MNEIQRRLQELLAYPREGLDRELKGWLDLSVNEDKANLAHAILALANHGGGYILIGYTEREGTWIPDDPRPLDLSLYTQDIINGIVHRYADPPFHCEVYHEPHPDNGDIFPIIVVPGDHRVPIRCGRDGPNHRHVQQNIYYVRGAGPCSRPIQSAQEWTELINRCVRAARDDLLDNIRDILHGITGSTEEPSSTRTAESELDDWINESVERWESLVEEKLASENPSRYSYGVWTIGYKILGDFAIPTLSDFFATLQKVAGRETGWPPWWVPTKEELAPYPYNNTAECWLVETSFADAAHSDFWRGSPEGLMFLLRGYQEDAFSQGIEPGTCLDFTIPVWRIAECLLHAERLALALSGEGFSVLVKTTWSGLAGRRIVSIDPGRMFFEDRVARQDAVISEITVPVAHISSNLPEVVKELTAPIYGAFDFFSLDMRVITGEISKMKGK